MASQLTEQFSKHNLTWIILHQSLLRNPILCLSSTYRHGLMAKTNTNDTPWLLPCTLHVLNMDSSTSIYLNFPIRLNLKNSLGWLESFSLCLRMRRTRLPSRTKIMLEVWQSLSSSASIRSNGGYIRTSVGYARLKENVTNGKADNHEGIDLYRPVENPDKSKPLWGENQWPSVPSFKEKYEKWIEKMKQLGLIVMQASVNFPQLPCSFVTNIQETVWLLD